MHDSTVETITDYLKDHGLITVQISIMGSYATGLNGPDSDIDYLVVYAHELNDYLSIYDLQKLPNTKFNNCDTQFYEAKQFMRLFGQSNVACMMSVYTPIFNLCDLTLLQLRRELPKANLYTFGNNLMGWITQDDFKTYHSYYYSLALEFILQYRSLPSSFKYDDLLETVNMSAQDKIILSEIFYQKKKGKKETNRHTLDMQHSFKQNKVLLNENVINTNDIWLEFLTEQII